MTILDQLCHDLDISTADAKSNRRASANTRLLIAKKLRSMGYQWDDICAIINKDRTWRYYAKRKLNEQTISRTQK